MECARKEWVAACQFHDLSGRDVLQEVCRRIQDRHIVILDLDSTLYEVSHRTYQILKEWISAPRSHRFPGIRSALLSLSLHQIGYSLRDTFQSLGLSLESPEIQAAWEEAKSFWRQRFFSNDYLCFDRPYPGAIAFVQEIHRRGARVIYLTGRDEPHMGSGTRKKLLEDGFPWGGENTHLLMKASFETPDIAHKKSVQTKLATWGRVVASFENEPSNLVALYEIFPEAMHVFVDTICSDRPALPRAGLYRLKSFHT